MKSVFMSKHIFSSLALFFITSGMAIASEHSGFLDDYSKLTADTDQPGAQIYRKQGADLKSYTKIMIEPVETAFSPQSRVTSFSPDELKTITDALYTTIVQELEPDYPVVNTAGPGVLRVRLGITGIDMQNKKRSLLGYTPIGLATTTLANLAGLRVQLKDAALEAEMTDSVSGEILGLLVDEQADKGASGDPSWEAITQRLSFYAKRFRARLDATHQ